MRADTSEATLIKQVNKDILSICTDKSKSMHCLTELHLFLCYSCVCMCAHVNLGVKH